MVLFTEPTALSLSAEDQVGLPQSKQSAIDKPTVPPLSVLTLVKLTQNAQAGLSFAVKVATPAKERTGLASLAFAALPVAVQAGFTRLAALPPKSRAALCKVGIPPPLEAPVVLGKWSVWRVDKY